MFHCVTRLLDRRAVPDSDRLDIGYTKCSSPYRTAPRRPPHEFKIRHSQIIPLAPPPHTAHTPPRLHSTMSYVLLDKARKETPKFMNHEGVPRPCRTAPVSHTQHKVNCRSTQRYLALEEIRYGVRLLCTACDNSKPVATEISDPHALAHRYPNGGTRAVAWWQAVNFRSQLVTIKIQRR